MLGAAKVGDVVEWRDGTPGGYPSTVHAQFYAEAARRDFTHDEAARALAAFGHTWSDLTEQQICARLLAAWRE